MKKAATVTWYIINTIVLVMKVNSICRNLFLIIIITHINKTTTINYLQLIFVLLQTSSLLYLKQFYRNLITNLKF